MDVQQQVADRLANYIGSEKFDQEMQAQVEKCVNNVVDSMFRYGELHKQIEAIFKEKLAIDASQLDFAHVNQVVTAIVREKTSKAFAEPLRDKLAATLNDMFAPAPATTTMQDLVDVLREELRNDGGCVCDHGESITLDIKQNGNYGHTLKIWNGERYTKSYIDTSKRENTPDLEMYVLDSGKIGLIHGLDLTKTFGTRLHGFDAKIFMMYCAGTVITDIAEVDPSDLNLRISDADY